MNPPTAIGKACGWSSGTIEPVDVLSGDPLKIVELCVDGSVY